MPRRRSFLPLLVVGTAALGCDAPLSTQLTHPATAVLQTQTALPSVLVILLDDARCDMVDRSTMPKLFAWVADSGLTFACGRGTANSSLCCPSRAGMFAGLDQHRTKVWDNSWSTGAKKFNASSTVFTAMPPGVVTALFGKWLNNSGQLRPWPYVVPGVDEERMAKHVVNTVFRMAYFNYTLVERSWQGGPVVEVAYGGGVQNYQPYVLARHFAHFVASVSAPNAEQQFVAFLTPPSPHDPAVPDPQDVGGCDARPAFRTVNYDAPRTGQPQMITGAPAATLSLVAQSDSVYRKTCETLAGADRMVDSVMLALETAGRLDDTYVIVTSDNAYHFGDLLFLRKATPFEGATNIPFMIRGPGVAPRVDSVHFAQIIDITPTILELAGVPGALPNLAGRSLVPLFSGALVGGYDEVLLEGLVPTSNAQKYWAVKTAQWKYIEFGNRDRALYDMSDPQTEMNNLAGQPAYAFTKSMLAARLAALKSR